MQLSKNYIMNEKKKLKLLSWTIFTLNIYRFHNGSLILVIIIIYFWVRIFFKN